MVIHSPPIRVLEHLVKVLSVDPNRPDQAAIEAAAQVIRGGGIVAFPTETVYGLGGNALDRVAVQRIFGAKGRPAYNPLIVHCADVAAARELAAEWPAAAERLANTFWPGPLTLVVRKSAIVPDAVTAGLATVALRVPDHPVALALLAASGVPVAAPSANRFSGVSPTAAEHVEKSLGDRVDLILDGGSTTVGIESTVIDLSRGDPILLRPGSLDPDRLATVIGAELLKPIGFGADDARPGPGMLDRHYSPRAELVLIADGGRAELMNRAAVASEAGRRVGALLRTLEPTPRIESVIRMPSDPEGYARQLYAMLHQLDDEGIDLILVETPPTAGAWAGVLDRLIRAATPSR